MVLHEEQIQEALRKPSQDWSEDKNSLEEGGGLPSNLILLKLSPFSYPPQEGIGRVLKVMSW